MFVEELNPANLNQVKYKGAWEVLRIIREEIPVSASNAPTNDLRVVVATRRTGGHGATRVAHRCPKRYELF